MQVTHRWDEADCHVASFPLDRLALHRRHRTHNSHDANYRPLTPCRVHDSLLPKHTQKGCGRTGAFYFGSDIFVPFRRFQWSRGMAINKNAKACDLRILAGKNFKDYFLTNWIPAVCGSSLAHG